ncbi:GGDEF domain-containing protein [Rhodanobacter sp. A1T4]|uniref:GGDEF domain-containing protein n=1 Tax=Rhodanobacter sp. A1T4 TaxID=2723087 RepID=UPI001619423E|nr:GGDEF domain-containing protein [Rhodanobacter sp. A1T4]MBB6245912.1 diguanylate cyclase (GGDEF)-like protein [Rhodanobacter sp. A1T4]
MPFQIETLSLISALQTAFMALMLWAGTYGEPGRVRRSLRIRSAALAVEALGWGTLAAHAYLLPTMLLLGGNAFNLLAQGMSVIALRMLLGESLRGRLVLAVGVFGWLGVAWFGLIEPNYQARVLWGSLAIAINILLSVEALVGVTVRRGSRARFVLLSVFAMAAALLIWRNVQLWLNDYPLHGITAPNNTNFLYVLLSGLQPLFAGIGFLLLYNEILQQELHLLARLDPLTGVSNRLAINEATTLMLAHSSRYRQPLGVLMLDADHFKSVNDRFGHNGGDKVLRSLVLSIRTTLRESDLIGRVGGEEFVVLSPGADLAGTLMLAERVRATVEKTPLTIDGQSVTLTVSVGVANAASSDRDGSTLLQRADAALYAAKRAGRNRVEAAMAEKSVEPSS